MPTRISLEIDHVPYSFDFNGKGTPSPSVLTQFADSVRPTQAHRDAAPFVQLAEGFDEHSDR